MRHAQVQPTHIECFCSNSPLSAISVFVELLSLSRKRQSDIIQALAYVDNNYSWLSNSLISNNRLSRSENLVPT